MEKEHIDGLPSYTDAIRPWIDRRRKRRVFRLCAAAFLSYLAFAAYRISKNTEHPTSTLSIEQLHADYAECASLRRVPATSESPRDSNKRWVNGTKPTLIRNATIWTGEPAPGTSESDARLGEAYAWMTADVLIDRGLIQKVGKALSENHLPEGTEIYDASGRQLTAGIVDMHSHAGLASLANLQDDVNEMSADITPFVRSLDGLDPLHPEFSWIKSGGVTTSLLLPGSGNNMGGEAFVVKLAVGNYSGRAEVSQQDMLADPDRNWRYMKMACGENPKRVYGRAGERGPFSRLGEAWEFRHAFEQAKEYVQSQDEWCAAADAHGAERMTTYLPRKLQWESLGAVLRGQVRVNTHCYTIPDLEAYVRLTNEFKFRLYAFHHAHQTYLVPEVLKRTWGGTPAAALFADIMYYKVESYTASEQAGKILYENGITPVYVSDNPVLNSQHVVFEAAKGHGYGLPYHVALAGVTSAPAELLGLGHRVGKIKTGYDADIVVWDSDPLSVGATPVQVWIDGAPQFKHPVVLKKPITPPLRSGRSVVKEPEMRETRDTVIFKGISSVYLDDSAASADLSEHAVAIVRNGEISCIGTCKDQLSTAQDPTVIELRDGYITPPFSSFGSSLGLVEIEVESDTHDGRVPDEGISRAVDGLQFGGKQLARAYQHGVTKALTAPNTGSINAKGVSAVFLTGAKHALAAVLREEAALHYPLTLAAKTGATPSISSAILALRKKLLSAIDDIATNKSRPTNEKEKYDEGIYLQRVIQDSFPLVLSAHSADTLSSIIRLKSDIEATISKSLSNPAKLRMIVIGGAESHLVAKELAEANVSVVLAPLLPHAQTWDQRRGLTGAPLTNGTAIDALIAAGVLVGISVEEVWETRDLGLLAGIAYTNSEGKLSFKEALDLVGANFDKMLGIQGPKQRKKNDWVVWEGSPLQIGGRVRGIGGMDRAVIWA